MRVLLAVLLVSLAACSSNDKKDKDTGPAELTSFDQEISLVTEWHRQVGNGMGKAFARLQPALQDSILYTASANGKVQALAIENGRVVWQQDFEQPILSGVGVGKVHGYIVNENGELVAFSLNDGSEVWRTNVKSEVLATAVEENGLVAVQTIDGHLYGIDSESGVIKWGFDSNLPTLSLRGTSAPVFKDDMILAGFANGKVVGLNLENGALLWQERIGIPAGRSELERLVDIDGRLLVEDNLLYVVGFQGHLVAIDLTSGKTVWKLEASSYHGPVAGLGNVYIVNENDHIQALDDRSASNVWEQVALKGRQLSEPVLFANHIAVADLEGYIHLIKQLDGSIVGRDKVTRPALDWVRTGSYGMKHPSRHFSHDPGVRTRLLVSNDLLIAINNSGYVSVYSLDR
ncbi:MAG: outer membrane protein assembly factor BamB [Psychrobacter glaciei]|jgi:outer membrane protein assembly factor BamB